MATASSRTSACLGGEALRDDSKRESQHERREPEDRAGDRRDRRLLFILGPPVRGLSQPIPYFDGRHHDDDRRGENDPDGDGIDAGSGSLVS